MTIHYPNARPSRISLRTYHIVPSCLNLEQKEQLSAFFDIYVKLLNSAAHRLESFLQVLIGYYRANNLGNHKCMRELEGVLEKYKLTYTKLFHEYLEKMKTADPEEMERVTKHIREQKYDGELTPAQFDSHFHVKCKIGIVTLGYQRIKYSELLLVANSDDHFQILDREMKTAARCLYSQWFSLFNSLFILNRYLLPDYKNIYRQNKKERILQQIVGSKVIDPELGPSNHEDIGTLHRNIAKSKRQGGFYKSMLEFNQHRVENEKYFVKADLIPIIFEETFVRADGMEQASFASSTEDDELTATLNGSK